MKGYREVNTALDRMTYGLYVLSLKGSAGEMGIITTWVMQVSFEPPLLAMALEPDSLVGKGLRKGSDLMLHVLPKSGIETAKYVLKEGKLSTAAMQGEAVPGQRMGVPSEHVLLASIKCKVQEITPAGDHLVCICLVESATSVAGNEEPLTLHDTGWKYKKKRQKP